jgi:hypothetical protein
VSAGWLFFKFVVVVLCLPSTLLETIKNFVLSLHSRNPYWPKFNYLITNVSIIRGRWVGGNAWLGDKRWWHGCCYLKRDEDDEDEQYVSIGKDEVGIN